MLLPLALSFSPSPVSPWEMKTDKPCCFLDFPGFRVQALDYPAVWWWGYSFWLWPQVATLWSSHAQCSAVPLMGEDRRGAESLLRLSMPF